MELTTNMIAKKAPNPTDKHVGARVRMRRMMLSMSQEKLGDALGLTFQQVQKYEKGANRIGASRLQQICSVLEIPVSLLFEDAPGSSPFEGGMSQDVIDFMESEEGVRVVAAFSRIADRKVRRGIVRLAGRIANHVQLQASAELLQFKKPAEVPTNNT